jgi:hypothetical protein
MRSSSPTRNRSATRIETRAALSFATGLVSLLAGGAVLSFAACSTTPE